MQAVRTMTRGKDADVTEDSILWLLDVGQRFGSWPKKTAGFDGFTLEPARIYKISGGWDDLEASYILNLPISRFIWVV